MEVIVVKGSIHCRLVFYDAKYVLLVAKVFLLSHQYCFTHDGCGRLLLQSAGHCRCIAASPGYTRRCRTILRNMNTQTWHWHLLIITPRKISRCPSLSTRPSRDQVLPSYQNIILHSSPIFLLKHYILYVIIVV